MGSLTVVRDGQDVAVGGPRQQLVLAALALSAGSPVSTERLIELVWDDRPPRTARRTVQSYVSALRTLLEPEAVATAEATTGVSVEPAEFTSAPGGGPSAGLTYLIAYLNLVSDGAFTDDVVVAATGELADEGYIEHIKGATEKIAAAHLADADVLFTSAAPSHAAVDAHAERHVGQRFGSRVGRVAIEVERDLHEYASWGATAPEGLDVVVVGHVADVAAYLCGAGSVYACSIRSRLADTVTTDELTEFDRVRLSANSTSTPEAPEAHTDVDFPR